MFVVIGDVHGCLEELKELLDKVNLKTHLPVFVGDIVDRGPQSVETYLFVKDLVESSKALIVKGNHDDKFCRYAQGRNVQATYGLAETIVQVEKLNLNKGDIVEFWEKVPNFLVLDDGKVVVVHAAFKDNMVNDNPFSKKNRAYCLFGPTTGKMDENGIPERIEWVERRSVDETSPYIFYGHHPYWEPRIAFKAYGIDTGCVFENKLTAVLYPSLEVIQVEVKTSYSGKVGEWEPPRQK